MPKEVSIVEVPPFGYSLRQGGWGLGFAGALDWARDRVGAGREYRLDIYTRDCCAGALEKLLAQESGKPTTNTVIQGVGTTGAGAGLLGFAAGGGACASGVCPLSAPLLAALGPFAAIPLVLTGGVFAAKNLGARYAMARCRAALPTAALHQVDYSPLEHLVRHEGLEGALRDYAGLRKQKRFLRSNPDLDHARVQVHHALSKLHSAADGLAQAAGDDASRYAYRAAQETYAALARQYGERLGKGSAGVILRPMTYDRIPGWKFGLFAGGTLALAAGAAYFGGKLLNTIIS